MLTIAPRPHRVELAAPEESSSRNTFAEGLSNPRTEVTVVEFCRPRATASEPLDSPLGCPFGNPVLHLGGPGSLDRLSQLLGTLAVDRPWPTATRGGRVSGPADHHPRALPTRHGRPLEKLGHCRAFAALDHGPAQPGMVSRETFSASRRKPNVDRQVGALERPAAGGHLI
jgi:hypothetical protein